MTGTHMEFLLAHGMVGPFWNVGKDLGRMLTGLHRKRWLWVLENGYWMLTGS